MIEDACPTERSVLQTTVRDGVGIDRDTGAARENFKFDYEVLETGPLFTLKMEVENLTSTDRQLLNLLLALLREGVYAGGKRSAGWAASGLPERSRSAASRAPSTTGRR